MKAVLGIIAALICLPISLWLQYQVLVRVNATELMFFLFWVNLPLLILMQVLSKLVEKAAK